MESRHRYEFRIWGRSLLRPKKKLQSLAIAEGPQTSDEIYLISAATDKCNAKVRSGFLDLKVLLREDHRLELWAPALKTRFPVSASVITGNLFPLLALPSPELQRSHFSLNEFLDEIVSAEHGITAVNVAKRRFRFELNQCEAEFAVVTISRNVRQTVAVESPDPQAVIGLVDRLGIGNRPHLSYVREIKRMLGIRTI
jgi:exopolyphosphatase / guanosine-5'-triphosphate,3'-diphosphate pyrophosphatase